MSEPDQALPWLDFGLLALLFAVCVAIAIIDWRRRIIPNLCNVVVALLGLVHAGLGGASAMIWAAANGIVIFALFWMLRHLYRAMRRVQGLGLGDVKFLGAAGVWIGLQGLAPLILVACASALVCVAADMLRGRAVTARHAVPFGPFLVLGLVTVLAFSLG